MAQEYVRLCPTCGVHNPPQAMRCACGFLLVGVDLVQPPTVVDAQPAAEAVPAPTPSTTCPHADCAQENPPGTEACIYCNRPMGNMAALASGPSATEPAGSGMHRVPQALQGRYELHSVMPTRGAEADLLLVRSTADATDLAVLKLYRHGLLPRPEVQQRMTALDPRHCVRRIETGVSEGHAYELMEYCPLGSLRGLLGGEVLLGSALNVLVRELNTALAAVHQAGLLHRDLKPENVLIRSREPLDLVLTDFGTASVLDATQRFTGTARSLPYASPESLSGVIDVKTDYWALGMIVLEAVTGKHPFADLSEAVILHQLATRHIDLAEVHDGPARKLLRGLLQRDPQQRWGATEVARWLARDPSLPEPAQASVAAEFKTAYHLGPVVCHTPQQLAVALARDWDTGCHDIANGLLLAWFRETQKDQNTLRLLIELRQAQHVPPEVQLLRLILHLAPGITPVWRGASVELPALLARAHLALGGDEEAAHALRQLHEYRVLQIYGDAGNGAMAQVWQRWGAAAEQFAHAWDDAQALLAAQPAPPGSGRVEDLLYAAPALNRPSIATRHAQLLALAYDPVWAQGLRQRLTAQWTEVLVTCPWLSALGDPGQMGSAQLLVLEALLPQAREAAARHAKVQAQRQQDTTQEFTLLKQDWLIALAGARAGQRLGYLQTLAVDELRQSLEHGLELARRIQALGDPREEVVELRRSAARQTRVLQQMQNALDDLEAQRTENRGWFGQQALIFVASVIFIVPVIIGPRVVSWLLLLAALVALWRIWPNVQAVRRVRELAGSL